MPPPDPPRLYLNAHLSPRLVTQLGKHGFDVTSSQESNMLEATDSEQLAYATAEKRAIVTFNVRDFAPLHEKYLEKNEEHWGIIFSTEEPIGVLTRRLLRLLNNISAQELKNQVRWLNEFQ